MMWSKDDLDRAIRAYSEGVRIVHRYRESIEVTAFLVNRDIIQDSKKQGLPLSEKQEARVEAADSHLIDLRPVIMRRFPEVFEDRGAPPGYWWWHPDEDPRVREQAVAAIQKRTA